MNRFAIFGMAAASVLFTLLGYAEASGQVRIANPASVYCIESGYSLEIRTNPGGGQYGVCIFPAGSECEEWAFFRKECGDEYRNLPDDDDEGNSSEDDR